ncbi:MAG: ribbon-helix-helix domain-containing protein [Hellea sp.]|nr:ribbon-helix-helix domain-containing protein [Hellea sp.]
MKKKRSLSLHGHRTSIALEPEFWAVIEAEAETRNQSLAGLLAQIDDQRVAERSRSGLASYLRVWVLKTVQNRQQD